jgi:O-antigen ligase
MLGLFTIFHFFIYYLVVTAVVREEKEWRWLWRIFLFAGSLVMLIGLLQKANPDFLLNRGSQRISATLGNPIYFSGYGLFLFFVGWFLFFKERYLSWKIYAIIGGLLGFWGIFGGGTRGTVLGLLVGLGTLFVSYLITFKSRQGRKVVLVAGLVGIALFGLLFIYRQTNFVRQIPTLGRLFNSSLSQDTGGTRFMAWQIAWKAGQSRPVFGWGPNNFYYAFNEFYRPEFLEYGWGETWFDNAHNIVMNTFATQGWTGLILYFGIFGMAVFSLWRAYHQGRADLHLVSVGTAFLVAHFVHNITVFENPTSYLYFFFFLAFITRITNETDLRITDRDRANNNISLGLAVVIGLFVLLFIYSTNINPARANIATLGAIRAMYSNPTQAEIVFRKALIIPSPHIDDIRNDLGRTISQAAAQLAQSNKELTQTYFDLAEIELQKNRQLHPLDIRVHIQQAQLEIQNAEINKNPVLLLQAEQNLGQAYQLSPRRQQVAFMLFALKLQLGKINEALQIVQKTIEDDPKIDEGWWRLVVAYQSLGQLEKAKTTVVEAQEKISVHLSDQAHVVFESILNGTKK